MQTHNIPYHLFLLLIISILSVTTFAYTGSSFNDIRDTVFSDPYSKLPYYKVNKDLFGPGGNRDDNRLRQAARRTLSIQDDLYDFPGGQKLLQPNGICFSGRWIVDQESNYTGQLSSATQSLVIARASVSLSETRQGYKRSFSMAVKIFPTENPDVIVKTLNLFTMESVTGSHKDHFLDAIMDNAPPLGGLPSFKNLGLSTRIYNDMKAVDSELSPGGPNLSYRPVSHLSIDADVETAIYPKWLRLRIAENTPRVDADDFREELRVENYPQQRLVWQIDVADYTKGGKSNALWKNIGKLLLNTSVTSNTCDDRLHFAHPILK